MKYTNECFGRKIGFFFFSFFTDRRVFRHFDRRQGHLQEKLEEKRILLVRRRAERAGSVKSVKIIIKYVTCYTIRHSERCKKKKKM